MRSVTIVLYAAIAMTAAMAGPSSAQMVYVDPGDGVEGRGVAIRGNGRCYVLTPAHVANAAGGDITIKGRGRASSTARIVKTFDSAEGSSQVDLAILELNAGGNVTCDEALPDGQIISRTLDAASRGIIQRINQIGQLRNSEALIRDVAPTEIFMTPGQAEEDQLHQGDSGSLVVVDRVPVAMLVAKTEQAKGARFAAIRLDMALSLANGFFASQRSPVRTFRFQSINVGDGTATVLPGRSNGSIAALPNFIAGRGAELRSETERLLSGTRGFPQIDNQLGLDEVSTKGFLTLSVVNVDSVRNSCRSRKAKVFGLETTIYEAGPGSVCRNGFERMNSILRVTLRLSGEMMEGSAGSRVAIMNQFSIVLPEDTGQISLPLNAELSNRMCLATKEAVAQFTAPVGTPKKPPLSGLFTATEVVPNLLANTRLKTSC